MLSLSDNDFSRLARFVKQTYGIDLENKKQLISGRLSQTLISMGFSSFTDYTDYILTGSDPDAVNVLLNKLTTNYTYFLREQEHFDYLKKTILPDLQKKHQSDKVLSIWSAGCSSGQEPYTISMVLKEYFGSNDRLWDTRVLATDISQNILNTAIRPSYRAEELTNLPDGWKKRYFTPMAGGLYTISPAIQQNVIFRTFNLMDPIRFRLKFDVIFCRNVMIYFDQPTKDALISRFYQATAPGGYLFIGHSESLNKSSCPYKYIQPAIYRKQV